MLCSELDRGVRRHAKIIFPQVRESHSFYTVMEWSQNPVIQNPKFFLRGTIVSQKLDFFLFFK